jgi:hypothetical protein
MDTYILNSCLCNISVRKERKIASECGDSNRVWEEHMFLRRCGFCTTVFDLRRYSFCICSVHLKSPFLFKNDRDCSNVPPHTRSLKSKEMIAVEPEKQRIIFTSQNKMQESANFFSSGGRMGVGVYVIEKCTISIRMVNLRK